MVGNYHALQSTTNYGTESALMSTINNAVPTPQMVPQFYPSVLNGHPPQPQQEHWLPSTMISYHHPHHQSQQPIPHLMLTAVPAPVYANSPNGQLLMNDITARSPPGSFSTGPRSAVVSPSETSSLSSESFHLHKCQVCQRKFTNISQLQAHLQTARHYKPTNLQSQKFYGKNSKIVRWSLVISCRVLVVSLNTDS